MNWTTNFSLVVLTLSLLISGWVRSQLYDHYGRKLRITPNDCSSSTPRFADLHGVCMFNLECQEASGTVIGACVDRFLFGACCHIPDHLRKPTTSLPSEEPPAEEFTSFSFSSSASSTEQSSTSPSFTPLDKHTRPTSSDNVVSIVSDISSTIAAAAATPTAAATSSSSSSFSNPTRIPPPPSNPPVPIPNPTQSYPTRFPVRTPPGYAPSESHLPPQNRSPEDNSPVETMDNLSPPRYSVSNRERPTVPPSSNDVTLLPLTLETFSSVSASVGLGNHGGLYPMYDSHGKPHDAMEYEALSTRRNKPRPSSTRITITNNQFNKDEATTSSTTQPPPSNSNSNNNINSLESTEEPPKISTFMYVDDNSKKKPFSPHHSSSSGSLGISNNKIINNVRVADDESVSSFERRTTSTPEPSPLPQTVEEKTLLPAYAHDDISSNTENIWSVVMQLGSSNKKTPHLEDDNNEAIHSLEASEMSKIDELSHSLSGGVDKLEEVSPGTTISDKIFGNGGDESETTSTGGLAFDSSAFLKLKTENDNDNNNNNKEAEEEELGSSTGGSHNKNEFENDITTEQDSSSVLTGSSSGDEATIETTARPWASSTYFVHTFRYPNVTGGSSDSTGSSSNSNEDDSVQAVGSSSTQPSIGKITTWSGIGSVVEKDQLLKEIESDETDESNGDSPTKNSKGTTSMSTTTTPTTTTTTTRRSTTRYTTRRTTPTTTTPATTEKPETTTERRAVVTEKWKKPKPYTLPPHKRPTTTEPTSPKTERITKRTTPSTTTTATTTTTTATTKKPKAGSKPASSSIILEEELDSNLDDFVDQVVQGLAGTLENLNLDEVILPQADVGAGSHSSSSDSSGDPTIDPLQVISDPSFPPFPIVRQTPLTKPNVKTTIQDKNKRNKVATTTTTTTTQKPLDWRRDCGVRTLPKSGRIVGGTASKFGKWPWQALVKEATWLGLFSKNKCGGVLIAPKYVLTAAHCQPGFLATLTVVLGDFDISTNAENQATPITKNVKRVIVHRDYNAQTFENDIALLELESPVDYKSHVVPICLPTDDEDFLGRKAFVTGWGRLKYGGGVPQTLHEVDVPILKNDECQDMFHKSGHLKAIRDSFICAGYAGGEKDSCEGDSGGPLSIQRSTGQWVLAGTVSHGIKCAYPNLPGVYMRMTFYKPWIKKVTGIK